MRTACTFALLTALFLSPAWSHEGHEVDLTLHPQAVEAPVLKYRLLPADSELKPGNAVPILLRLPWEQNAWMTKVYPTLHEWEARPLTDPEWKNAGHVLPPHFFNEMRRAAYRREAAWEYPIGEQVGYSILLPDVQGLRGFIGNGLASRICMILSSSA